MATTFPLTTLSAVITPTGVVAPPYADILESLKASFQSIYGADAYLDPDSQDGQWIAIQAKAISDCNDAIKAAYNAFSPNGAVGVGLSANVKINGIQRKAATNSEVTLVINGTPGTQIVNGIVRDTLSQNWMLPALVTIPAGGALTVTATAQNAGPVLAAPNTVKIIGTPIAGWGTVNNAADAVPGKDAEDDAQLRSRQSISVSQGETLLTAILSAVENVDGVQQARIYENDTGTTNSLGIPAHSIGLVILGGDATAVGTAIMNKKGPGPATFGTTSVNLVDSVGNIETISWTIPTDVQIDVALDITALQGYTSDIGIKIQEAIAAYISLLPTGDPVYYARLFQPALLLTDENGEPLKVPDPDGKTFKINSLLICVHGGTPAASDVAISYSQHPLGLTTNVALTVH